MYRIYEERTNDFFLFEKEVYYGSLLYQRIESGFSFNGWRFTGWNYLKEKNIYCDNFINYKDLIYING